MNGFALCDCCGASIDRADGYLLPTRSVVISVPFWETQFELAASVMDLRGHDENRRSNWFNACLRNHAGSQTPWLVCDDCIAFFVTDYGDARTCARHGIDPPKVGAVDPGGCALFAAIAWESIFGRWPATVEQPSVGDYCDFCGRKIYRGELTGEIKRETLERFRSAGALNGDPLRPVRQGKDAWLSCMDCMACTGTKMMRAEGRL